MDHQQEITYGELNDHVIESQDGVLAEVCALWVCFSFTLVQFDCCFKRNKQ